MSSVHSAVSNLQLISKTPCHATAVCALAIHMAHGAWRAHMGASRCLLWPLHSPSRSLTRSLSLSAHRAGTVRHVFAWSLPCLLAATIRMRSRVARASYCSNQFAVASASHTAAKSAWEMPALGASPLQDTGRYHQIISYGEDANAFGGVGTLLAGGREHAAIVARDQPFVSRKLAEPTAPAPV